MPVRQAGTQIYIKIYNALIIIHLLTNSTFLGVIYFKNLISQSWAERDASGEPAQEIPFSIHEQDRAMIRDSIVEAVVHSPDLIK